ncbi:MAG: histidine kinase [Actinomycetia bacterium]|nr:histidine kinase [Actinomycetes bacterium]
MSKHETHPSTDTYPHTIYRGESDQISTTFIDQFDVAICFALFICMIVGIVAFLAPWFTVVGLVLIMLMMGFMIFSISAHMRRRPSHLIAPQSDRMIAIAIKTTALLRQGLTEETAMDACAIILDEMPSISAVAITNTRRVLGYAGVGCIHHQQWRVIKSAYTKESLREKTTQVVTSVGCIDTCCPLKSAIIVPFILRDQAVGTLKLYYADPLNLTDDELAMAESLAGLVSVQLEVQELEEEAAFVREMELKMLQAQIDPHFLFNTLNTIASLTRTNPQQSRDLISNLAQFYRYTLEEGTEEETLRDSIEMVMHYFDLEQARFGERLHLHLEVDDSLLDFKMPRFMLQPLVENCIRHGMRPDGSRLTIWMFAELISNNGTPQIRISVIDDGQGATPSQVESILLDEKTEKGLGLALRNVRGRLKHFYGLDAEMEFISNEGSGVEVTYKIPYRSPDDSDR